MPPIRSTPSEPAVALIAVDPIDRTQLTGHLQSLGFEPRRCAALARAGDARVVICVRDRGDAHLLAGLPAYRARTAHRVVVITRWPNLVRQLAGSHADALAILVPPLLLHELVDALRGAAGVAP